MADNELAAKLARRQKKIEDAEVEKSQDRQENAEFSAKESHADENSNGISHGNSNGISNGNSNGISNGNSNGVSEANFNEISNGKFNGISEENLHENSNGAQKIPPNVPPKHQILEKRVSDGASEELKARLDRRQVLNEGGEAPPSPIKVNKSLYAEFHEFSRKQIKTYEAMFKRFDENGDGFLDFEEVKRMMEKLGAPQTHLALKQMIREVDEDQDKKISLREFFLIFRKAAGGEFSEDSGLSILAQMTEVDVQKEGVGGAKNFFEAKIDKLARGNAFEAEIRAEMEENRREAQEKKDRQAAFRDKLTVFKNI